MAAERSEFENEVRELVSRVLTGVLDGVDPTPEEPPTPAGSRAAAVPTAGGERIAIGADHGGYDLKQSLVSKLIEAGHEVEDVGTDNHEACDYPDFAHAVARQVAQGKCGWGIMIDGAGIGSAMAANKVPGVRAAACYDLSTARNSREHNQANVLTLGAGLTGSALAWEIVQEWLATPWGGGRHLRRVALIDEIEDTYARGRP
jgi:RpiB/LacA/LacB family sugar-phosphate isomerase